MKPVSLFVLLLVFFQGSCRKKALEELPGCPISESVRHNYTESGFQILLKRYHFDPVLSGKSGAIFSSKDHDKILGCIQSVYALNIPERDTIFDMYRIQVYPAISPRELILSVDTEAPEIKRILAGDRSHNAKFDYLLSVYQFDSFSTSSSYPSLNYIVATSRIALNMLQVAKEMEGFPFILGASPNGYIGDGDNIEITDKGDHTEIDFSIGRGDCPAGCTIRRHWIFRVSGCTATFLRSYGG